MLTSIVAALQGVLLLILVGLLIAEKRERKRLIHEKNTMVALLSHRLYTPLSTIKWYLELLMKQEFGELRIAQMELLDKIDVGVQDAIGILNTFLEAARIERGNITTKPVTLDLWEQIDRVIDSISQGMKEKKHTLKLERGKDRVLVYVDPLILHTVLDVVVSNAVSYTPPQGSITIGVKTEPNHVIVKITDTGVGMTPIEQTRLFSKFFRGDKTKLMSPSGNGLGLYLVKHILEDIGGTIRCTSTEGKGSTFYIGVPKDKTK